MERQKALIKFNAIEQALNVLKAAPVQAKLAETDGKIPRVHAFIYDPATGMLEDLNVDVGKYAQNYDGIYSLS